MTGMKKVLKVMAISLALRDACRESYLEYTGVGVDMKIDGEYHYHDSPPVPLKEETGYFLRVYLLLF